MEQKIHKRRAYKSTKSFKGSLTDLVIRELRDYAYSNWVFNFFYCLQFLFLVHRWCLLSTIQCNNISRSPNANVTVGSFCTCRMFICNFFFLFIVDVSWALSSVITSLDPPNANVTVGSFCTSRMFIPCSNTPKFAEAWTPIPLDPDIIVSSCPTLEMLVFCDTPKSEKTRTVVIVVPFEWQHAFWSAGSFP